MPKFSILDTRFIAPPLVLLLLVFLYSPGYYIEHLGSVSPTILIAFLSAIIFVSGIFISGISEVLFRFFNIRQWGYSNWLPEEQAKIHKLVKAEISLINKVELGIWIVLGHLDKNDGNVRDLIGNRWHWATANTNLCVSTLLGLVIAIFGPCWSSPWDKFAVALTVLSLLIFGFNAFVTHISIREMHRALFRRADIKSEQSTE